MRHALTAIGGLLLVQDRLEFGKVPFRLIRIMVHLAGDFFSDGVREHAHGGTVLIVAPGSEHTLPVRLKFEVCEPASHLAARSSAWSAA